MLKFEKKVRRRKVKDSRPILEGKANTLPRNAGQMTPSEGVNRIIEGRNSQMHRYEILFTSNILYAGEPAYNDNGLHDTSPISSNILRYQLIPHC